MNKISPSSGKYSVIEIALSGQNLRATEKASAREILLSCRIPERNLVSSDYKGAFRLSCYSRSVKKVREVREKYKALGIRSLAFKVKKLKRRDWFDKWKRDYHIGSLGAKFMIVPVWEKHRFKSGRRIPIFLEPGSAFGSGYHETTRLITRLLESLAGKIGSFLDIGCGTGILSVAAAKLGAPKVTGYDNDRPSALVAEKNFRANKCANGIFFCAQLKRSKVSGHFDTVAANLLSKALLEHRARIIARVRPRGFLLVSGIALQNFAAFKHGFSGAPLKCLKVLRGRRWVAVLYKRLQAS
jgi:ribosomal protein L11 methyltransferase